ncbi:MAG TPA: di-heme oxidoredictase family protein [Polyangiaceae bacterium]
MAVLRRLSALAWVFSCVVLSASCAGSSNDGKSRTRVDRPGLPLSAATDDELLRFREGDALFEATVRESDGLGPLYVRDSCAACHQGDGRGPGFVNKFAPSRALSRAELSNLLPFGATERPFVTASAKLPLLSPDLGQLTRVRRLPPAVFGRGYLEAISEQELERIAQLASARTGSVRGRPNRLKSGAIGRFGLKARLATLEDFTADALNGDMGVTTPLRPHEPAGPEGLDDDSKPGVDFDAARVARISDYVRLLEIPVRKSQEDDARALFSAVGCATCHVPSLHTDPHFRVASLADIDAPIFSDLLLHDMGQALSDGQYEEDARPREFRTAPLLGLRFLSTLLHDGRAHNVAEAIEAHGAADSEGRVSVQRYRELSADDRARLVRFVEAL